MIVGPVESLFNSRDYSSIVFDEAPQIQLPSIPSTSNITVTIFDEDELEEDPDRTITPADFYRDENTLSVCTSPILCEWINTFRVCTMADRFY